MEEVDRYIPRIDFQKASVITSDKVDSRCRFSALPGDSGPGPAATLNSRLSFRRATVDTLIRQK
jgi:hypothetical protein